MLAFVLSAVFLTGCASPVPRSLGVSDPVELMVAGDSLSGGYYASDREHGFVAAVTRTLGSAKVYVAERAHQTLSRVSDIAEVPAGVDIAIIELGTNDVGIPTPDAEFAASYEALVKRVIAASPDVKLVCLGTWTGWGWTQDQTIRSACEAVGGTYVHLRDLFDIETLRGPAGRDTFLGDSDDFHPNDAGHAAIASRITAALDQM